MVTEKTTTSCFRSSGELKGTIKDLAKTSGTSSSELVHSWVKLLVESKDYRPFFIRLTAIVIAERSDDLDVAAAEQLILQNLEGV